MIVPVSRSITDFLEWCVGELIARGRTYGSGDLNVEM